MRYAKKYLVSSVIPVDVITTNGNIRVSLSFYVDDENKYSPKICFNNPKEETPREIEQVKQSIRLKKMRLREVKYNVPTLPMKFTVYLCQPTYITRRKPPETA